MLEERNTLPIVEYKQQLLDMINNNAVIIVRGQTGSGKTTQVFTFIFMTSHLYELLGIHENSL